MYRRVACRVTIVVIRPKTLETVKGSKQNCVISNGTLVSQNRPQNLYFVQVRNFEKKTEII